MNNIKLISLTKSEIKVNDKILEPEELIVYTARVSSPNNQNNLDTSVKLLKFLINNSHWSPLEMVDMTVEVQTSRALAQQILRHRSFVFQEYSQRYAKVDNYVEYEARRQDTTNRQNSIDDLSSETKQWFEKAQNIVWTNAIDLYNKSLDLGIAKEQARFLLPLNTQTRLYMKGSIRSWVHYLQLRCGNGTQLEHSQIAKKIRDNIFKKHFPNIYDSVWGV